MEHEKSVITIVLCTFHNLHSHYCKGHAHEPIL